MLMELNEYPSRGVLSFYNYLLSTIYASAELIQEPLHARCPTISLPPLHRA